MANAKAIITMLLAGKTLTTFKAASLTLGFREEGQKYFTSLHTPKVIKAFEEAMPGASALVVNGKGLFSTNKATAGHPAWLKAQGYTEIPERVASPKRTKGGTLARAKRELAKRVKSADLGAMSDEELVAHIDRLEAMAA